MDFRTQAAGTSHVRPLTIEAKGFARLQQAQPDPVVIHVKRATTIDAASAVPTPEPRQFHPVPCTLPLASTRLGARVQRGVRWLGSIALAVALPLAIRHTDEDAPPYLLTAVGGLALLVGGRLLACASFRLMDAGARRWEQYQLERHPPAPQEQLARVLASARERSLTLQGLQACVENVQEIHRRWPQEVSANRASEAIVSLVPLALDEPDRKTCGEQDLRKVPARLSVLFGALGDLCAQGALDAADFTSAVLRIAQQAPADPPWSPVSLIASIHNTLRRVARTQAALTPARQANCLLSLGAAPPFTNQLTRALLFEALVPTWRDAEGPQRQADALAAAGAWAREGDPPAWVIPHLCARMADWPRTDDALTEDRVRNGVDALAAIVDALAARMDADRMAALLDCFLEDIVSRAQEPPVLASALGGVVRDTTPPSGRTALEDFMLKAGEDPEAAFGTAGLEPASLGAALRHVPPAIRRKEFALAWPQCGTSVARRMQLVEAALDLFDWPADIRDTGLLEPAQVHEVIADISALPTAAHQEEREERREWLVRLTQACQGRTDEALFRHALQALGEPSQMEVMNAFACAREPMSPPGDDDASAPIILHPWMTAKLHREFGVPMIDAKTHAPAATLASGRPAERKGDSDPPVLGASIRRGPHPQALAARRQLGTLLLGDTEWWNLDTLPRQRGIPVNAELVSLMDEHLSGPHAGDPLPDASARLDVLRGLLQEQRAYPSAHLRLHQLVRTKYRQLPADTASAVAQPMALLARVPPERLRGELDAAVLLVRETTLPRERTRMTANLLVAASTFTHWPADALATGLADPSTIARLISRLAQPAKEEAEFDRADLVARLMQVCQRRTDERLLRHAVDALRSLHEAPEPLPRPLASDIDRALTFAKTPLPGASTGKPDKRILRHAWLTPRLESELRRTRHP